MNDEQLSRAIERTEKRVHEATAHVENHHAIIFGVMRQVLVWLQEEIEAEREQVDG